MDITAKRAWLKRGTGSEAQVRHELARALDEIERLRNLINVRDAEGVLLPAEPLTQP